MLVRFDQGRQCLKHSVEVRWKHFTDQGVVGLKLIEQRAMVPFQELFIDQRRQHPCARLLLKALKQDRIGQRSIRLQGKSGIIHDADRFADDVIKESNDIFPILLFDLPVL